MLMRLGVRPQRYRGQHFLIDDEIVRRQVGYAELHPGESVLEIGPGLGILTEALIQSGARIVAIENDSRLCNHLRDRFGNSLELIEGDATEAELPPFDKVVANLPYQISSEITFRLLEREFKRAILMYQKEFAERLVAGEASAVYGRLSVMAAYRAESEILEYVSRRAFWPEPKIDSAIVMMKSRPPRFHPKDERYFMDVVRILFSHRRKKISNALVAGAGLLGSSREAMREMAKNVPYETERVEMLTPEEIGDIADYLWEQMNRLRKSE